MKLPLGRYRPLLVGYILPQWRLLCLLSALVLGTIGLELVGPQILRVFIDHARSGGDTRTLTNIGLLFLGVAIATQIVSVAETYAAENLGWVATNRLRADLALHCLRLDLPFHGQHTPGELIERIDGDVTTLANFFSRFVVYVFANGLLLLGVLVLLFQIDWRVSVALGAFTLVSVVTLRRIQGLATPHWVESRQASAELFGFLEERLAGTEDIRSCGATAYVMLRLYERCRRLGHAMIRASMFGGVTYGSTQFLFWVGMAIALGLGAYLVRTGAATIGTAYLIFSYMQMMTRPIEQIMRQLQDFQQAMAGAARVQELLEMRSGIVDGSVESLPVGPLSVEFDAVSFAYGEDEPVLRDVSFSLKAGKVLGVLGQTGSGKTTMSRLLFRLYDPICGAVRLGGMDLRTVGVAGVHQRIGMVTQDVQLFHASVRDNLTFFDRSVPDERIEWVLEDLGLRDWRLNLPQGLDTMLVGGGTSLSAGEAQLLAFARVFLQDPALVVLDEASSRLDPVTEWKIERAVERLLESRTGIIIAHRLRTIRRVDEILVLGDGRVQEYGPREMLARDPSSRFARMLRIGLEGAPA